MILRDCLKLKLIKQPRTHFQNIAFSVTSVLSSQNHSTNAQYQHAKVGAFKQEGPVLHDPYQSDGLLKAYLKRTIPQEHLKLISADLENFGKLVHNKINEMGRNCELNPPVLTRFNAWGDQMDQVNTCNDWKEMKKISAEEGLVAHGYLRNSDKFSRLHQFAKIYLFAPSSGMYSCPLAMLDGAAFVLESLLKDNNNEVLSNAFSRLTSKDCNKFWTSGQWMTEKAGGSDVANATETVAHKQKNGTYKLYGYKWFTSATDADMALTLARVLDESGNAPPGTKGLSLFYLETRKNESKTASGLNGIQILRLKDKLGTRQLPTGELLLDGTVAHLVGEHGKGVRLISGMLTVTRIHNSVWSAASMKRILLLSKDYATKRQAFGTLLCDHPLHIQTLARMEVESRAAFLLTFEVIRLLGVIEVGGGNEMERNLLRLLTPIAKLYTAKQAISVASEGLESFGGAGYLEDTGLPGILRDAQVLSIWEGTTNILALDTLRAIAKSKGQVLNSFFESVNARLSGVTDSGNKDLKSSVAKVSIATGDLRAFINQSSANGHDGLFLAARDFAYSLFRIYSAVLILEHAAWAEATPSDQHAASIWCSQDLSPAANNCRISAYTKKTSVLNRELVYNYF